MQPIARPRGRTHGAGVERCRQACSWNWESPCSTAAMPRTAHRVPPPRFVRVLAVAFVHRALYYRLSGGRFLWTTSNKRGWGACASRRSAQVGERTQCHHRLPRRRPDFVALAMNGGTRPSFVVAQSRGAPGRCRSVGTPASAPGARTPPAGEESDRLWQRWVAVDPNLDAYAGRRSTETPVIVLEPRDGTA